MESNSGKRRGRPPKNSVQNQPVATIQPVISSKSVAEAVEMTEDEALARAIQASLEQQANAQQEDYYALLRAQEEADAELARQLMEEENSAPYSTHIQHISNTEAAEATDAGDDIDEVMQQIADREAQERLARDEEERRIRERARIQAERQAEIARQDAEYEESLRIDRAKAITNNTITTRLQATPSLPLLEESSSSTDEELPPEPEVPKTKEELRNARLAFFLNKKPTS